MFESIYPFMDSKLELARIKNINVKSKTTHN
ncbi:MAG: hypothetical protein UR69_C0005G0003 [Candidatus Moranbacteria bacterium GW2011_GWE2_35_2-]|nr:MAG: hypothetical protein UR69_C0005G0003 [Candidatus Moranbacteria bacterium GW2011_GWE2_35_2-]KKQ52557.1 MAG: hypothetical protein US70_C0008G0044 [Parcubacteria group bacterium GW2011_GWD2_38_11]